MGRSDLVVDTADCQYGTRRRPERLTLGHEVAEIAGRLGIVLKPWQRYVADVALEIDPDTGLLAFDQVNISVGRRSGKTLLVFLMALRRLVEEARKTHAEQDAQRHAKERAYRFMSAIGGGLPGFEEASRALFAHDAGAFGERIRDWPADVQAHLSWLARGAFATV